MENRASKEEEAIGVDVKDAPLVDTPPHTEEYSNILERKNMSKREFYWLWAGYYIFSRTPFPSDCTNHHATKKIDHANIQQKQITLSLLLCIPLILSSLSFHCFTKT